MYTISEVSAKAGISAHTLRYYEKIGLLPSPERREAGAIRSYSERDLEFIVFLTGLKKTGMTLESMAEFVQDGCILKSLEEERDIAVSLERRKEILNRHLQAMEEKRAELERVIALTRRKLGIYEAIEAGRNGLEAWNELSGKNE